MAQGNPHILAGMGETCAVAGGKLSNRPATLVFPFFTNNRLYIIEIP
jgi:hypothetical protein